MRLLVVDGNSIVNRAFYGIRPLTNREGQFTHAIYGFLTMLRKIEKEENPDAVAVAFDLKAHIEHIIRMCQRKEGLGRLGIIR